MKRFWLLFAQAVTVLLAAYFVVLTLQPQWLGRAGASAGSTGSISILQAPPTPVGTLAPGSFNAAVRKAEETSNEKMGKLTAGMPGLPGGMKFPF